MRSVELTHPEEDVAVEAEEVAAAEELPHEEPPELHHQQLHHLAHEEFPHDEIADLSAVEVQHHEGVPHLPPALPDAESHDSMAENVADAADLTEEAAAMEEPPLSPRYTRTTQLLAQFPGLSIPEAMRAAKYTLEESFDPALQDPVEEFLVNNPPLKKVKRTRRPPGSQEAVSKVDAPPLVEIDPSKLPPDIVISSVRPKNASGRCLCRVEGCRKLDQANNDGFCRAHFNLIRLADEAEEEEDGEAWSCECGQRVGPRQKRCGACNRWKDGARDASSAPKEKKVYVLKDPQLYWECDCGNQVPEPKSRCGKCHHWKGGKRLGGWKLGTKSENVQVDDIDRSEDWECCGDVLSAKKTRCGKCRKWRGGKRQVRWSYGGKTETAPPGATYASVEEEGVDPTVDWVCRDGNCKMVNKGTKKRCSSCFSWRFSRKRVRASTGGMSTEVGGNVKDENEDMTLDQLDALVKEEIQNEGGMVEEGEGIAAQILRMKEEGQNVDERVEEEDVGNGDEDSVSVAVEAGGHIPMEV